jgi:GntP family gluconate:H+ symporter
VLLISSHTIALSLAGQRGTRDPFWSSVTPFTAVVGNPNAALMVAAAIAIWLYVRQRAASREEVARMTERALMSAGMIILITAAGGAFGATLQAAQIGPAIQTLFAGDGGSGLVMLFLGFGIASLMKIAQGSSTVAMITTAAMIAAMLQSAPSLPFHPVYIATAISAGSLVGTWMNDSGFWVFSKMGGVSEVQTLRTWTPLAATVGVTAMATTIALSFLVPLR